MGSIMRPRISIAITPYFRAAVLVAAYGPLGIEFQDICRMLEGTSFATIRCVGTINRRDADMKKIIIAAAIFGFSATASFAQSGANPSAPQPGSTGAGVNQPGTTATGTAVDRPDTMKRDGMSGTSGMNNAGTSNKMQQGGASKDGMGQQNKGGMSK
jgi:hypothetical protein